MNLHIRASVVRAMDTLARAINDEDILEDWLVYGVADGDIKNDTTDEELEWYCEDDEFAELMGLFLRRLNSARKDGGLYVDGVVSN